MVALHIRPIAASAEGPFLLGAGAQGVAADDETEATVRVVDGGGGVGVQDYQLDGSEDTFRVNPDGSTTPIVQITATSGLYGVTYTWFVSEAEFVATGPRNLANLMTADVNAVCGYQHVQDFRTEQDQGPSRLLYNFAVITVGTDDQAITKDVTRRMDMLNTPETFTLIDAAWQLLLDLGAPPTG